MSNLECSPAKALTCEEAQKASNINFWLVNGSSYLTLTENVGTFWKHGNFQGNVANLNGATLGFVGVGLQYYLLLNKELVNKHLLERFIILVMQQVFYLGIDC